ncbi:hypothetical protein OG946_29190 [Streptomyces sp. NBC_01808]|uniref:hypothetical protein n=1 Tax=Streptomyces sp. NBC_01808 TaxID=2975947 RepID=UPI002DD87CA0|nr:hypothetical protein [Streptomyces sp. NBC_01808]WSA41095.1 hypothetical protein OG946_29190 [Streptomyces sp. NBC_01808]
MEMRGTADRTADDGGEEKRKGKIELSGAQVAGGASATMVAAFLASSMGVYGTIIGAGVVSVGATAGGALFQHVFRRTGQQLKDAAVAAPKALHKQTTPLRTPVRNRADDETHLLRTVAPPAGDETRLLPGAPGAADDATQLLPTVRPAADDATQLLPVARPEPGDATTVLAAPAPTGGFGSASTHGTRARGWRRLALVAAGTFTAVMAVVFGIEKLTGGPLSNAWGDDRTGTSFSPGERKSDSPPAPGGGGHTTDDTHEPGTEETGGTGGTSGTGSGEPRVGGTGSPDEGTGEHPDPGGTSTPRPGGGDGPAPGTKDGGTSPAPTPTPTPPGTGEEPEEPEEPGTGEAPASPQPDGTTAPGAPQ